MFLVIAMIGLLLVVIGWGLQFKQWYFLISGYNTMPKEEQEKVKVTSLALGLAIMSYILGLLLIILSLLLYFNKTNYSWMITILIVVVSIGGAIYAQRFLSYRQSVKKKSKYSAVIVIVTIIAVGAISYLALQPTKFTLSEDSLTISGTYGDEIPWNEISSITMLENLPEISIRTNGSSAGSKLKGNFKLKSGEQVRLFIDQDVNQLISFEWNDQLYMINEPTSAETEDLYMEMNAYMKK